MAEPTCIHAVPHAADQLHGICIFCYRDRLGAARAENAALRERLAAIQVHAAEITKERDYRERTSHHDNYTDQHRSGVREARAIERLIAAAIRALDGAGGA